MAAGKKTGQKKGSGKTSGGKSKTPLLVLIILMLLAAMVIIINRTDRGRILELPQKKERKEKIITEHHDKKDVKMNDDKEEKKQPDKEEEKIPEQSERIVSVYFIKINETTEKIQLVPVKRKVKEVDFVKDSIGELLQGPSSYEKKRGYLSAIPENLRLRSVRLKNKTAVLDFNAALGEGAGGDILLGRIDQIVYTATQFKEIESVEITINGKRQNTLGADGLSISGPLHRRH